MGRHKEPENGELDPERVAAARALAALAHSRLGSWRAVAGYYNHYAPVTYSRLAEDPAGFAPSAGLLAAIEGKPPPAATGADACAVPVPPELYERLDAARRAAGVSWPEFLARLLPEREPDSAIQQTGAKSC